MLGMECQESSARLDSLILPCCQTTAQMRHLNVNAQNFQLQTHDAYRLLNRNILVHVLMLSWMYFTCIYHKLCQIWWCLEKDCQSGMKMCLFLLLNKYSAIFTV